MLLSIRNHAVLSVVLLTAMAAWPSADSSEERPVMAVLSRIDVAPVWPGNPVRFSLYTHAPWQYVAFFDADARMTIAARRLDSPEWTFVKVDQENKWDSHNYITMAIDRDAHLHVSGDMHNDPLVYFRTREPLDITTLERVYYMIPRPDQPADAPGHLEERCTYPSFLRDADGRLVFTYRFGASGRGVNLYNVYDPDTRTWSRLLDEPLFSGDGERNAYPVGPRRGPDGRFHVAWIWRDTYDCATNHTIGYARSDDLAKWENAAGEPLTLPIRIDAPVVVDPVLPGGGAINGNTRPGFDLSGRPVVSYIKFDEEGNTQAYNARWEGDAWRIHQTSDWDYRWEFSGGGSIEFEVRVGPVGPAPGGGLQQSYSHKTEGSGVWRLADEDFRVVGTVPPGPDLPAELKTVRSEFDGMRVLRVSDSGKCPDPDAHYQLRWEALGPHRDRPREGPLPNPTILQVYKLSR